MDFKKGFDLVDHNVIVKELVNLGVEPVIILFFQAANSASELGVLHRLGKKTNGGLPQGTKLGPLLFAFSLILYSKTGPEGSSFLTQP